MASYADQLAAAKTASQAANALEAQMRSGIEKAFDDWDAGVLTNKNVRFQLERIVRTGFRSAASVAASQVARQSELPGWKPQEQVFSPEYLKRLLEDTRRNLRDYVASKHDETVRRRVVANISHSAGVGVHAGFTAQQIASYRELQDFGMQVRKFWSANFNGHEPCVWCRQLHGTEVGLREQFENPNPKAKTYQTLHGPPLHPNCQCFLVTFITTLENAGQHPDLDTPSPAPQSLDTAAVQRMPLAIFNAVVAVLRKVLALVRGKR